MIRRTPTMSGFPVLLLLVALGSMSMSVNAQDDPPATPPGQPPEQAAETQPDTDRYVHVRMKTSLGDIVLELDKEKAPITVENFMSYVDKKHYDGTVFHRVIANFMIQGGGFSAEYELLPTDAGIKNEWQNGLKNTLGTIAMARKGNQPDSATNQFFINVKDNAALDQPRDGAAYAVFGKVIGGMETVEAIRTTPTTAGIPIKGQPGRRLRDVPVITVLIESVRRIEMDEAEKIRDQNLKRDPIPDSQPTS